MNALHRHLAGVSRIPAPVGATENAGARDGDETTPRTAEAGAADEGDAVRLPAGLLILNGQKM